MKHVDVKANRYLDFNKENKKESNFEVGDQVIILKCRIFLQNVTFQIGPKKFL